MRYIVILAFIWNTVIGDTLNLKGWANIFNSGNASQQESNFDVEYQFDYNLSSQKDRVVFDNNYYSLNRNNGSTDIRSYNVSVLNENLFGNMGIYEKVSKYHYIGTTDIDELKYGMGFIYRPNGYGFRLGYQYKDLTNYNIRKQYNMIKLGAFYEKILFDKLKFSEKADYDFVIDEQNSYDFENKVTLGYNIYENFGIELSNHYKSTSTNTSLRFTENRTLINFVFEIKK